MKFLIAGLGSIGRRHLRNLVALGERDILLYRTHHSTLPDEELADFPVETDLQAALSHKPDAVIVANPTALHMEVALPAVRVGCHLLLEKPISHTLEGIEELKREAIQCCVKVLVGFQFRFNPGLRLIAAILANSSQSPLPADFIGRPLSIRAHWGEYLPGWHAWEDYRRGYAARSELGGGVILTLCHPLDYLHWLLGEVNTLFAFSGRLNDLDLSVEDTTEISLRFANGMIGSLHLDYNQRPASHHLEIIGTQGTLRWNNADGLVSVFSASDEIWHNFPAPERFERNDMFLALMQHFLAVVRGEAIPACSLDDGIKALQLALAAHRSAQEGQAVSM